MVASIPSRLGSSTSMIRTSGSSSLTTSTTSRPFDASVVAERHFVSVRTMDEMFRAVGQSPSAWIRSRRLAHCRADLRDPQYRDMGVADIARRWGFPSPAHFSRAYRAAFGVSPSSDRRRDDDA